MRSKNFIVLVLACVSSTAFAEVPPGLAAEYEAIRADIGAIFGFLIAGALLFVYAKYVLRSALTLR